MYFGSIQSRLLNLVRERVRSGELTERNLARMTGVSQPHMHNILKGIRALSPEFGDELLHHLGLTLMDLCTPQEVKMPVAQPALFAVEAVPVFQVCAESEAIPRCKEKQQGVYPFPKTQIAPLTSPIALLLGRDDLMAPRFQEGDLVLLDRAEEIRMNPEANSCYVVDLPGGTAVRYIRRGGRLMYLATETSVGNPGDWDYLSVADQNILEIVRGRIVWIGRHVEPLPAEPARKAG